MTSGGNEVKSWTFVTEPLVLAILISVLILPLGSIAIGAINQFSMVAEGNVRDWINQKWNRSDFLKYRRSRDLVVYALGKVNTLLERTRGKSEVSSAEVKSGMEPLVGILAGIKSDDAEHIDREWKNLRNQNLIQ